MVRDVMDGQIITGIKAEILDATITVIARDGFDVVSVRTVAKETDLAPGTVQYHFRSRDDLLVGAMMRYGQRTVMRLAALAPEENASKRLLLGLAELLPLDELRQEEGALWVAISSAASTRLSLKGPYLELLGLMRERIREVLIHAHEEGILREGMTPDRGAYLLTALVNGLTIDGINAPEDQHPHLWQALEDGVSLVLNGPAPAV